MKKKTKTTSRIKPMLAYEYEPHRLTEKIFVQPKLDGIRCIAVPGNPVVLYTRAGKVINSVPHINDALNKIKFDFIIDGELYSSDMEFNKISGICRYKMPVKECTSINYWMFDTISSNGFKERFKNLERFRGLSPFFSIVPTHQIDGNHDKVIRMHDLLVYGTGCNFEGMMIRLDTDEPYIHGRSYNLMKYKDFKDEEFVVLDVELGDESKGLAGHCAAVVCETKDGKKFKAKPEGDREFTKWMADNPDKIIGQKITVKYQNLSEYGIPRFGIAKGIRWDK